MTDDTLQKNGLPNREQICRDLRDLAGESEGFDKRMLLAAASLLDYAEAALQCQDAEVERLRAEVAELEQTLGIR